MNEQKKHYSHTLASCAYEKGTVLHKINLRAFTVGLYREHEDRKDAFSCAYDMRITGSR